jgi:uncharacterized membrane protein YgdD (TMEM256/DUF423 family)
MQSKHRIATAGFLLALSVALGAFGAHALEDILTPERLQTWETAVFYQTWNALGLVLIVLVSKSFSVNITIAYNLLLLGIFIFSGSLYILCLSNIGWFGAITPIGGVSLIAGWIVFAYKTVRETTNN